MSEKSTTRVAWSKDRHIATIRFTSEGGVNIFSSRVVTDLGQVVQEVAGDSEVRFAIFRGEGKVFLAGADISEMSGFDEAGGRAFGQRGHETFDRIAGMPQVTIAAMHGAALGGGCELALACDFRLCVAKTKIGLPESTLGLIPGWGGTQRLPRIVGDAVARRLIFSGVPLTGPEAAEVGLVDEVAETPELLEQAVENWIGKLSLGSPHAVARAKQALLHHDEVAEFGRCFTSPEAREGIGAFLEKRKASWAADA
jgi:enoyl-CoA hydratase